MLFVIAGLGNPGEKYGRTRHNMGFRIVDRLAENHSLSMDRNRFSARIGQGEINGRKVLLLKPETYMNLSGEAVGAAMRFYKVPPDRLVVVQDDIDLALGRIQIRRGGGHGGHRGVQSVMQELGDADFVRVRAGTSRPEPEGDVSDFVLGKFDTEEAEIAEAVTERAAGAIESWLESGLVKTMNLYNQREPGTSEG